MASITQIADFKGEINVANKEQTYVAADLQIFIDKYEPDLYGKLLGDTLYGQYKTGLAIDPVADKWTALQTALGISAANYIYWYYMGDQTIQTVGVGAAQTKVANATIVSPGRKMIRAWNEMVDTCYSVVKLIQGDPDSYGAYYIENFYYKQWFNTYCNKPDIFEKVNSFNI